MIDSRRLLADLTKLLATLEADLRRQVQEREDVRAPLQADYDAARQVGRTQDTFETWCEEPITQAAVAWLLGAVYVRFLEDNALVEPMLSGTGARYTRAQQEHQHYFQLHPTHSERQYLEHLFARLEQIPATKALFDRRHNPLWRLPLSADAARAVVEFWQRIEPDTGQVAHDFADPALDTRFLGDLYQDLSEPVRKRYALLQTPRFVEAFILDRTLTPAIETFGYREVRLIDPTCGSGHFLLGAFDRLLALAQEHEPGKDVRVLVKDVLSRVAGVDINPYAVAIAHFRLMVAALRACGITRLADAPGFEVSVVAADSLLHGPRFADLEMGAVQRTMLEGGEMQQYYFAEDETKVHALLGRQYHAVVGNPPYITVKDPALREMYRQRYGSCSGKYALVVPFMERFFELALQPDSDDVSRAGYVGLIVANSFMKREFGKKLIEEFIPRWDMTHVVDTSGAYIPGHGTPTAIVFGRHRRPQLSTIRAVRGIRGEPSTPDDSAKGLVWTAILDQIDRPGSESAFVSVADVERASFHRHPWSIGGGGAAELKESLDLAARSHLKNVTESIAIGAVTLEDEVFSGPVDLYRRIALPLQFSRQLGTGDEVRDWAVVSEACVIFPYDSSGRVVGLPQGLFRFLWPFRTGLRNRVWFGKTQEQRKLAWYEYGFLSTSILRTPLAIALAEIATHNHFVLDRGGKVFNQTAPVIKLPLGASEDDHLALLGVLNSSTACFWLKQTCFCKGLGGQGGGIKPETWHRAYAFNASQLEEFPVVGETGALAHATRRLIELSSKRENLRPSSTLSEGATRASERLLQARNKFEALTREMVGEQERIDWIVYLQYGLISEVELQLPPRLSLEPSERPSELLLKRRIASGESSSFYDVHKYRGTSGGRSEDTGDTARWVTHALDLINRNPNIRLIETADFKRRWQETPWEEQCHRALERWMLERLEAACQAVSTPRVLSTALLSDMVRDEEFWSAGEAYTSEPEFDVAALVDGLLREEAVPFLPVLRYKESGLAKRAQWERTWDLQRFEDAGEKVGDIPVPPKYASADFKSGVYWRLRGKLDVPKERFISYPGCERAADGSLPIAWAGWDHAQQARALGAYYMQIKTEEGTVPEKLVPLLTGLLELIPWIRQWHAGPDPEFGLELGPYYADFVENEARTLGLTPTDVRNWVPKSAGRKKGARKPQREESQRG